MYKPKKILSVILAVLMLMSFTPLFASAAVTVNTTNCTLVEAPKLSYKGGEPTSDLVVAGGIASRADIAVVGGKVAYNGTEIEGFFGWSSSPTGTGSTTLFAAGNVIVGLYFHPTDTENYKKASWRSTAAKPIEGWPTLTVEQSVTTVAEAPENKTVLLGTTLGNIKLGGGKVVNQYGDEITAGEWKMYDDNDTQDASNIVLNEEGTFTYKAVWTAKACDTVYADVQITVAENLGYTIEKPYLPQQVSYWATGNKFGDLPFVYGESSVPGTYSVTNPNTSMQYNYKYTVELTFTPDDPTLPEAVWTYTDIKLKQNDEWTLPDSVEKITIPYGYSSNQYSMYSTGWPEEFAAADIRVLTWDETEFNAADHEPGYIQKVKVRASHNDVRYAIIYDEIYIQIEPRVVEGKFGEIELVTIDMITGKQNITFYCSVPGITGEVQLKHGDTVIATFKPDENGNINESVKFLPKEDGEYFFTATYIPDTFDKTIISNPVITSRTVTLDVRKEVTVNVYNVTKVQTSQICFSGDAYIVKFYDVGYRSDEVEFWEVKDQNGKTITVYGEDGNPVDLNQDTFRFIVPEASDIDEINFYPHGAWDEEIIIGGEESIGDTLVKLWQKIANWLVEIYRIIMDFFVPSVTKY